MTVACCSLPWAHVLWNMHPAHLFPPKINACALELYNEDLLDLAVRGGAGNLGTASGWDIAKATSGLKLQERPIGKEGRVVPEVRFGGVLLVLKQAGSGLGDVGALMCLGRQHHAGKCWPGWTVVGGLLMWHILSTVAGDWHYGATV